MAENRFVALLMSFSFLSLTLVLSSNAEPIKEYLPSKSTLLDNPHWSIIVVTADKSQEKNGGGFFVDEVLRGNYRKSYIQLIWLLPNIKPRGLQAGDKLIVFVSPIRDVGFSNVDAEVTEVYKFSGANRQTVFENMAPSQRTRLIQLPLLLLIILIPVVLLTLSKGRALPLIFLQFFLYLIYESGISKYSNIRIDLLMIYPALLASVIIVLSNIAKRKPSQ